MNRKGRVHSVDLWGHSTGLPQIHVGNYMNLNNNDKTIQTNTAPQPFSFDTAVRVSEKSEIMKKDKELQKAREVEHAKENKKEAKRWEHNMAQPKEFYNWLP